MLTARLTAKSRELIRQLRAERDKRAIEAEVLQAPEPVDAAQQDCYCGGWTDQTGAYHQAGCPEADAAPQPPAPCQKCEGRANGTLVAMPVGELKKLQSKVAEQSAEIERLTKADKVIDKAIEDINWMTDNGIILNRYVFEYLDEYVSDRKGQ